MQPTVSWIADTLPYNWLTGKRFKNIHTVGAVGQVKFMPVANNEGYTGTYETGAEYGLIRFSCGAQPDTSKPLASQANRNFAPGFGLKFLIDGQPSANLVTLTAQQDSWNFFANDFTNHIPIPPEPIFSKFKTATDFPQHIGISDFSKHHHDGKEVASPKFPFALTFQPTDSLKSAFPADYSGVDFTNQLSTIPSGTKLFSVLAQAEPNSSKVHIGDLFTTSEITKSLYGDQTLFFKHQSGNEDVSLRPEWKEPLNPNKKLQSSDCPMHKLRNIIASFIEEPRAIALGH